MLSQVETKSGADPSTTTIATANSDSDNFSGDKAADKADNYSHRDINKLSEEHKIGQEEEQKVSE